MTKKTREKSDAPNAAADLNLDALYPADVIAKWMRLSKRTVLELAREGKIPVVRLNERVLRFHPRAILEMERKVSIYC